jgi:hypothetical protein
MAEVNIVDGETGRSVPRDRSTMGEIVLRAGCVMLGYLYEPESSCRGYCSMPIAQEPSAASRVTGSHLVDDEGPVSCVVPVPQGVGLGSAEEDARALE